MQVVWRHLGLRRVRRAHLLCTLIEILFGGWRSQMELVAAGHLLQQVNLFPMDMPHLVLVKGPLIMAPRVALPRAGLMAASPLLLQPSSASTACTGSKLLTRSPRTTVTRTWASRQRVRRCQFSQRRRRPHYGNRREQTPPTALTPHRHPPRRCHNIPPPPSAYAYCCASGTQ